MTSVIQDAVTVTRALSVRYLWIDALCIIQGDGQDWARESQVIGLVYSNAFVTICSLSSSSCLEGFLDRPTAVQIPFRSSIRPEIAGTYGLRRQPRLDGATFQDSEWSLRQLDLSLSNWMRPNRKAPPKRLARTLPEIRM